jgi:hypothetical protein
MTESQPQDSTRGKKSWATSVGLDIDSISFHLQWDEPLWEALEGSHLLLSPPQKQAWETMGKTSVHLRDPSAVESTVPKQKTVRDRNAGECKSSFYKPQSAQVSSSRFSQAPPHTPSIVGVPDTLFHCGQTGT